MFQQGAFQINPNLSPEEVQRRRDYLASLQPSYGSATTLGEGVGHLGQGIFSALINRRLNKIEREKREGAKGAFDSIFAPKTPPPQQAQQAQPTQQAAPQAFPGPPIPPVNTQKIIPNPHGLPQSIVDAVNEPEFPPAPPPAPAMDPAIQAGIFKGESGGGDYDALFDFSQRPGKKFDGIKPTEMTISELVEFTDPNGEYGQWVKGHVGRVATPVGAYQVVGRTLRAAVSALGIPPDQKFDKATQDRIGKWILDTQGTGAWEGYRGPATPQQAGQGTPQQAAPVQVAQNGVNPELMEALANPWLTPAQRTVLQGMVDQQSGGGEYGLTPQYVTMPDGTLRMLQLSKSGDARLVDLPAGAEIQKGVQKLDLGTHYQQYNTITGAPIGPPIPKNLAEAEAAKISGKTTGAAAAQATIDVPGARTAAKRTLDLIGTIINDPALPGITGMIQGRMAPWSQAGTDLNAKIEQLKGTAFLTAFESIKGGGSITETEGKKASAAQARLNRAQSTEEYIIALQEMSQLVIDTLSEAENLAGVPLSGFAVPQLGGAPATVSPTTPGGAATHRYNPATGDIEEIK